MKPPELDEQFSTSTRGRIVMLLRRSNRTVEELAQALSLTDNTVRAHLTALERDGLARRGGTRRGVSKPAFDYELTPQAERLFPRAHDLVLRHLIDELSGQMGREQVEALLRNVGRRIAAEQSVPTDGVRTRLEGAISVLNALGGLVELEEREEGDESFSICGYRCPLFPLVSTYPEVCRLTEALISEVAHVQARERCLRGDTVWCWFEVP